MRILQPSPTLRGLHIYGRIASNLHTHLVLDKQFLSHAPGLVHKGFNTNGCVISILHTHTVMDHKTFTLNGVSLEIHT